MQKTTYSFSSRYQDVDFDRIRRENPDADFIRIAWPRGGEKEIGYLITESGLARLKAVDMDTYVFGLIERVKKLDSAGRLLTVTKADHYVRFVYNIDKDFDAIFATLREREERRYPIQVTAIK